MPRINKPPSATAGDESTSSPIGTLADHLGLFAEPNDLSQSVAIDDIKAICRPGPASAQMAPFQTKLPENLSRRRVAAVEDAGAIDRVDSPVVDDGAGRAEIQLRSIPRGLRLVAAANRAAELEFPWSGTKTRVAVGWPPT